MNHVFPNRMQEIIVANFISDAAFLATCRLTASYKRRYLYQKYHSYWKNKKMCGKYSNGVGTYAEYKEESSGRVCEALPASIVYIVLQ